MRVTAISLLGATTPERDLGLLFLDEPVKLSRPRRRPRTIRPHIAFSRSPTREEQEISQVARELRQRHQQRNQEMSQSNSPGRTTRNPYRPNCPTELNKYPDEQQVAPIKVHELREKWIRDNIDWGANASKADAESKAAAEQREAYQNRRREGTQ